MGCDVHLHIEVKLDGKWEHWGHPSIHRWYTLFGKMAGVRDESVVPIAEPRGLPKDATTITLFDSKNWGRDGHSHSWLSADEIENQLYPWFEDNMHGMDRYPETFFGYLCGNGWDRENMLALGLEDFRFVFWFDN